MAEKQEKTYEVVGKHSVMGHAPGTEFQADLGREQERAYIEGGFLKVKGQRKE